jgi:hypothetical protein
MSKIDRARRPRRIAADEAHAWARNLKLGNIHAKLILSMLSLYVDAEGACFVSIASLAMDCEMSPDTVRRRLAWLEEVGAIARTAQWLDENGNRNGSGRGKRTTDLIRLLYEVDPEAIEARAAGEVDAEIAPDSDAVSPSPQQGLNSDQDSVSTRLGLGQPSHCSEGLISEPEPEPEPLKSPEGTREANAISDEESEPEHFAETWGVWPEGARHRRRALQAFSVMTHAERVCARVAAPLFLQSQIKLGRSSRPELATWLRDKRWLEFPDARGAPPSQPESEQTWVADGSPEDRALRFLRGLTKVVLPFVMNSTDRGRGYFVRTPVGADAVAMLTFEDQAPTRWQPVIRGTDQFAAWQSRFAAWTGRPLQIVRLDDGQEAIRVPGPWPPKKDGTIYRNDDQQQGEEQR